MVTEAPLSEARSQGIKGQGISHGVSDSGGPRLNWSQICRAFQRLLLALQILCDQMGLVMLG